MSWPTRKTGPGADIFVAPLRCGVPDACMTCLSMRDFAPLLPGGSSKEQFVSPFVLPKLPSRVYVRFGEAISLEGLDRRDKMACQEAYERVKVSKRNLVAITAVVW